ncbi:MAG TPA: hypothetical protein VHC49_14865 [Mycobacteriales bacterium]|nr:hypothetical protein [Mycobacteriales bacterium]
MRTLIDPVRERLEVHNSHCCEEVARTGLCGFVHMASGRVCKLPERHTGPCRFESVDVIAAEVVDRPVTT